MIFNIHDSNQVSQGMKGIPGSYIWFSLQSPVAVHSISCIYLMIFSADKAIKLIQSNGTVEFYQ